MNPIEDERNQLLAYLEELKHAVDLEVATLYEAEHLANRINAILGGAHPTARRVSAQVHTAFELLHNVKLHLMHAANEVGEHLRRLGS